MSDKKQKPEPRLTDYQQEFHISRKAYLQDLGYCKFYDPEEDERKATDEVADEECERQMELHERKVELETAIADDKEKCPLIPTLTLPATETTREDEEMLF